MNKLLEIREYSTLVNFNNNDVDISFEFCEDEYIDCQKNFIKCLLNCKKVSISKAIDIA